MLSLLVPSALIIFLSPAVHPFSVNGPTAPRTHTSLSVTRRSFLPIVPAGALSVFLQPILPSNAAVGEGTRLPDGAAQFSRILKAQSDWKKLGSALDDRVAKKEEIGEDEWKSTSLYLRKLYGVGDDMKFITATMDKSKKSSGEGIAKEFQNAIKAADKPAMAREYKPFSDNQKKSLALIDDFLALLQDIPDEI
mmetsp:Transcript_27639/g.55316  ORF Transcript_27639/g.55316 Transcript_27639/m.55316 type:complete len:194 (-) Transcript_27639:151-732(-)